MVMPNLDAKLRILILDSKDTITQEVSNVFGSGFELTRVNNFKKIVKMLSSNPLPWYSLVIYERSQLNTRNLEEKIMEIREADQFVPHMVYGKNFNLKNFGEVARGTTIMGVTNIYDAECPEDLRENIRLIFIPSLTLPNLTVVKMGGSAFDFDIQTESRILDYVCKILTNVHLDRDENPKIRGVNRIILTVGAGPYGDVTKNFYATYGLDKPRFDKHFSSEMFGNLKLSLHTIHTLFEEDSSSLIEFAFFYNITEEGSAERIPLIANAPHYILARDGIPLQDSDTHTVALAEFYGAERIVLIKRTDGIYNFDPYRGFVPDQLTGKCVDLEQWKKCQQGNRRYGIVTLDEMLNGSFSREGTGIDGNTDGSSGHLMEDSALEYMRGCKHVKEVLVVHIAPEELYYSIGGNRYKHIITGETIFIDPQKGWIEVLENNLKAAVMRGESYSKIVRGN